MSSSFVLVLASSVGDGVAELRVVEVVVVVLAIPVVGSIVL